MDLIERLFELRASGSASVVSQLGSTELQRRMHVKDPLEDWLVAQVVEWRGGPRGAALIVLSGRCGDGKSDLLARLHKRFGGADDLRVITDATQSDAPTEDQRERLAEFFRPFGDDPVADKRLHLIALNVGMALSFLDGVSGFGVLGSVLRWELGLARQSPGEPPFELTVVNLDRRDIMGRGALLLNGMLDRLDPENSEGIFGDLGARCDGCSVRDWCFVRTNLDLLQRAEIRERLAHVFRDAARDYGIHLSPRATWDALSQIAGGDAGFFGHAPSCKGIQALASQPVAEAAIQLADRLLWNAVFAPPGGKPSEPVRGAMQALDPISSTSGRLHASEGAVLAGADAERQAFAELSEIVSRAPADREPVLKTLASALEDKSVREDLALPLARGISRRAVLLGWPADIAAELLNDVAADFDDLLRSYSEWIDPDNPPPAIKSFTSDVLRAGTQKMFGTAVQGQTYFQVDAFATGGDWEVLAPVKLAVVQPQVDPDVGRRRAWLGQIGYIPREIACTVSRSAYFVVDLPLYRLLRRVVQGYAASSLDLERFFALRFACERLGGMAGSGNRLMLRDGRDGSVYRIEASDDDPFGSLTFTEAAG